MSKRSVSKPSRRKKTGPPRKNTNVKTNSTRYPSSPWDEFIGMFKDDADFKEVKASIARTRKQLDLDTSRP